MWAGTSFGDVSLILQTTLTCYPFKEKESSCQRHAATIQLHSVALAICTSLLHQALTCRSLLRHIRYSLDAGCLDPQCSWNRQPVAPCSPFGRVQLEARESHTLQATGIQERTRNAHSLTRPPVASRKRWTAFGEGVV